MKQSYVKKCSCCDKRFSKVAIPLLDDKYKNTLGKLMQARVDALKLKGSFALICRNNLITHFYYEYVNTQEHAKAKELCNGLLDIAFDFSERHSTEAANLYYEGNFA
jgi:hypothetical protein